MRRRSCEVWARKCNLQIPGAVNGRAIRVSKDKFEVSQAVAERVLLPAVRNAAQGTLIVADGFSCREQVLQGTGKPAIHLAEVLKMALRRKDSSEAN